MFLAQTYQQMEDKEGPSQASEDFEKMKDEAGLKKTLKRNS